MKLKFQNLVRSSLLILLLGCNPVKQVMKDQSKFDKVAEEVIRRGYCVNDTTVITETRDSIVYKDSIIERISSVPCKDFDTTIGRARIRVSSGVLTYSAKDSIVYKKKTITNTVRDRSLENILKGDISKRDSIISAKEAEISNLQIANKDLKADIRWWKFRLFFLLAVIIGWTVGKSWIKFQLSKFI